jgi:hypothetical protein
MKQRKSINILKIIIISLVFVLAVSPSVLWSTLSPEPANAADTAVISISPSTQNVNTGETFTVSISVVPNNAIAGIQFSMTFDPSLVSAGIVQEGNLLTRNGASSYFSPGNIDNVNGKITGVFGAITTPGQTVSASGTFATIILTAGTTGGACPLNLVNVIIADMYANALPISMVNGSVNIDAVAAASSLSTEMGVTSIITGAYTGKAKNKTFIESTTGEFTAGSSVVMRAWVKDEFGNGLANATVSIEITGAGGVIQKTGLSNNEGWAEVIWKTTAPRNRTAGTKPGTYTITLKSVTAEGYVWDNSPVTTSIIIK